MKSKNSRCSEVMQFYDIFLLCLHNVKAAREFLKHSFSVKSYVKIACLQLEKAHFTASRIFLVYILLDLTMIFSVIARLLYFLTKVSASSP